MSRRRRVGVDTFTSVRGPDRRVGVRLVQHGQGSAELRAAGSCSAKTAHSARHDFGAEQAAAPPGGVLGVEQVGQAVLVSLGRLDNPREVVGQDDLVGQKRREAQNGTLRVGLFRNWGQGIEVKPISCRWSNFLFG